MKEKLLEALTELITSAVSAKDFIVSQTPEVVQQTINWYGGYYFILFALGLFIVCLILIANYIQYRCLKKDFYEKMEYSDCFWWFVFVFGNIAQILWLIPLSYTINLQWLKIWIAPKLWLIEFAAKMARG